MPEAAEGISVNEPVSGKVKTWNSAEGWGVLTSPELPDDVWAHFSAIQIEEDTFRALTPQEAVIFTWERADQDGYSLRALEIRRAAEVNDTTVWGTPPPNTPSGGAYSSSLDITWD
jgi:cold shock CspA family protein